MPGTGPALAYFNPTTEFNDLTPKFDLGYEVEFGGNRYIYVRHHQGTDVIATVAGQPAFWRNSALTVLTVTADKTDLEDGATNPSGCAGIYLGVVTHLNYTWLQKRGRCAGVVLDGNGANGNKISSNTSDQDSLHTVAFSGISAADAASQLVGIQKGAGSGNKATVLLMIP
jgi:hypothetical protein